jgi:hypothetical protein
MGDGFVWGYAAGSVIEDYKWMVFIYSRDRVGMIRSNPGNEIGHLLISTSTSQVYRSRHLIDGEHETANNMPE